ncbi:MAG: hypothetical protein HQK53_06790 [Oligoflexia bacterium]|nr:hypothetical protein [Oligoflexia bacterium]
MLTIFLVLYIPCIASVVTLYKEGGIKTVITSVFLNLTVALVVSAFVAWITGSGIVHV